MQPFKFWNRRLPIAATLVAALVAAGTLLRETRKMVPRYQSASSIGYLVNSMLVTKEPNKFGLVTGVHLIYVNPTGFARVEGWWINAISKRYHFRRRCPRYVARRWCLSGGRP